MGGEKQDLEITQGGLRLFVGHGARKLSWQPHFSVKGARDSRPSQDLEERQ